MNVSPVSSTLSRAPPVNPSKAGEKPSSAIASCATSGPSPSPSATSSNPSIAEIAMMCHSPAPRLLSSATSADCRSTTIVETNTR